MNSFAPRLGKKRGAKRVTHNTIFRRAALLMAACLLAFSLAACSGVTGSLWYPRRYAEQVEKWAQTYELDPMLVYAVIRTESGFDPEAVSTAGARGLMQMIKETFFDIKSRIAPNEDLNFSSLFDPETSIRFGCYYLSVCLARYGGDTATAAAAYHSGMGRVDQLLQNAEYTEDGKTLTAFPDTQMNHYVKKILSAYSAYTRLYA